MLSQIYKAIVNAEHYNPERREFFYKIGNYGLGALGLLMLPRLGLVGESYGNQSNNINSYDLAELLKKDIIRYANKIIREDIKKYNATIKEVKKRKDDNSTVLDLILLTSDKKIHYHFELRYRIYIADKINEANLNKIRKLFEKVKNEVYPFYELDVKEDTTTWKRLKYFSKDGQFLKDPSKIEEWVIYHRGNKIYRAIGFVSINTNKYFEINGNIKDRIEEKYIMLIYAINNKIYKYHEMPFLLVYETNKNKGIITGSLLPTTKKIEKIIESTPIIFQNKQIFLNKRKEKLPLFLIKIRK